MRKTQQLFSITGWQYKWFFEIERGPFRVFKFIVRRELKRWL